jgi:tetratricopeptide (TPR) repeat protein
MRLGSLEESKYALHAYLDLVGVPDFDQDILLDDVFVGGATEASDATHEPHEKDSATAIAPPLSTTIKANSIINRLIEIQDENIDSVINVLLCGIYLYGHEEQNGKIAAYLSDLGLDLLLQSKHKAYWAEIYRSRGCAYSLLASQCEDPDDRVSHHQTALECLQNAIEKNRACWKNFYTLSLQQALMRDTHSAVVYIRRSLELNPHYAPSWHLLSLLYSCKRTDRLSLAAQTLELGLQVAEKQQSVWSLGAIPVYSWTKGEVNANDVFERAETLVSMRMSQLVLLEAKKGPEGVIDQYQDLFSLYSQLTQQLGLLETTSVPSTPIDFLSSSISTSSTTNRPRRKSSISLIRRTSLTSLANSITGGSSSSIKANGRPRSSSMESKISVKSPSVARRAESDTDDFSDDSTVSRQSSYSRRQKKQHQPTFKLAAQQQQEAVDLKKRSLQLIDLGLARRIGTAAANPAKHNGSSRSFFTNESSQGAVSLASMLTPSYSMGSLRSNSVSSKSSSVLPGHNKAVTKDGLIVSTFHQHHQVFQLRKKTRWHSLLVTLWLMSAKTFMKANLLEEANKALGEAEQLGLGDPNVWWHLGQLSIQVSEMISQKKILSLDDEKAIREMKQVATDSFEKALILDPDHVPSQIAKASILTCDLALGLLEQITLGLGWDSSEAWYQYAQVKKEQGDYNRVKSCLLYALELHDTEPLRNLSVLPKFII